ncbi:MULTISPECIES: Wzz/FepE/Etk N-terminal domain-containing protein [unclassified Vibrio]|uniref:Wzz/FepE/Etk N-terminal domain-containing protein n=1 Tax=unclassified Vibrio TaxID=2614977 RepID=UPI0013614BE3|nr:LPS chain length-determining protein [Vibrio sp. V36_P2S2PM302]NAX21336.1 LPS chain length-determining protein [Vibrio sp. V39_P1S14PM300]NAX26176.1 LPS chain length-determining protein [Vibrio sp. V38_P2S17PM301]NAX32858.1 LPS chain length-determining protein [Vibrio sp. V37_P2S8PM304]
MTGQSQQPIVTDQHHPQVPAAYHQNDEIDLRELFKVLWKGKLTVIFTTIACAGLAVAYALLAQQWWSSTAKVTEPQLQDMAAYQLQVKQFQPIFDIYQEDGTVLVSRELDSLIDTKVLFKRFVDSFNSSDNKRVFLDSSEEFQAYKAQLDLAADENSDGSQDGNRKLYAEWFQKITAKAEDKTPSAPYDLSFQSTTQTSSYSLLNEYLQIIRAKAREDALNNLQTIIDTKHNELVQQKRILESQARNRLEVEAERAQYALNIAKAAEVDKPIQSYNDKEIFSIDLGTKALAAKVTALESVKNLSVIEPRLQQIDAKLDMLKTLKIDRDIQFQTFRFLENVEQPISRDKPKRALIAVLGTLLGGMLGVAIVLVRFAFRREDDESM